jgi:hypothetical protein
VHPERQTREFLAGTTGLEPATSGVTGRRSDQLSYVPTHKQIPTVTGRSFPRPSIPRTSQECRRDRAQETGNL